MSLWAGIKHALNSTIGTEEFESLDKMIKGQKSLIASDNPYCMMLSTLMSATSENTEVELCSFKMLCNGSFKFKCYVAYSQYSGSVYIYKNDTFADSISMGGSNWTYVYSDIVSAKKGDVIKLTVERGRGGSASCSEVYMLADIVDNSAIKIIS